MTFWCCTSTESLRGSRRGCLFTASVTRGGRSHSSGLDRRAERCWDDADTVPRRAVASLRILEVRERRQEREADAKAGMNIFAASVILT